MNISLQVGRGFAALALCVAVSAFAATHPAPAATESVAAAQTHSNSLSAHNTKLRVSHEKKQCAVAVPSIEIGAPIALNVNTPAIVKSAN